MHSASLPPLLKLEALLEAADQVLSPDLLHASGFRRIKDLISEALQRVTTERLRLEFRHPESA